MPKKELKKLTKNFCNLVDALKGEGYGIQLTDKAAIIAGKKLYGGFAIESDWTYLQGKVAVDPSKCFVKWAKCSVKLSIPQNKRETKYLLKVMAFLGTEEGYKFSNEFEFITEYRQEY